MGEGKGAEVERAARRPLYLALMTLASYSPGTKVRVTQQVPRLTGVMVTTVEGAVMKYEQAKTGSWYAHSRDHKLWMDRLTVRKNDGEIVVCNLDQYSSVEMIGAEVGGGPGVVA